MKKIISLLIIVAAIFSLASPCLAVSEADETEFLKKYLDEKYIVSDEEAEKFIQAFKNPSKYPEYAKYTKGYLNCQPPSFLGVYLTWNGSYYDYMKPLFDEGKINLVGVDEGDGNFSYGWLFQDDVAADLDERLGYIHLKGVSGWRGSIQDEYAAHFAAGSLGRDGFAYALSFAVPEEFSDLDVYYLRIKMFFGLALAIEDKDGVLYDHPLSNNQFGLWAGEVICGGDVPSMGDVNYDSKITTGDILLLRKYLNGDPERIYFDGVDFNSDGRITSKEMSYVRRCVLGYAE